MLQNYMGNIIYLMSNMNNYRYINSIVMYSMFIIQVDLDPLDNYSMKNRKPNRVTEIVFLVTFSGKIQVFLYLQ